MLRINVKLANKTYVGNTHRKFASRIESFFLSSTFNTNQVNFTCMTASSNIS